jgi:hypothetical protein
MIMNSPLNKNPNLLLVIRSFRIILSLWWSTCDESYELTRHHFYLSTGRSWQHSPLHHVHSSCHINIIILVIMAWKAYIFKAIVIKHNNTINEWIMVLNKTTLETHFLLQRWPPFPGQNPFCVENMGQIK